MKFRIWMDHPESDFHGWLNEDSWYDLDDARRECEMLQDTSQPDIEYMVINTRTGYPWFVREEDGEKLGFKKRT